MRSERLSWKGCIFGVAGVCGSLFWLASAAVAADARSVLPQGYFRFVLAREVVTQAELVADDTVEADAPQVSQAAARWHRMKLQTVRMELESQYPADARDRFAQFVAGYTLGEQSGDVPFLARLSEDLGFHAPPRDYPALRTRVYERVIHEELGEAARFLAEIQTWADVGRGTRDAPSLDIWLARQSTNAAPEPAESRGSTQAVVRAGPAAAPGAETPSDAPRMTNRPPAASSADVPRAEPEKKADGPAPGTAEAPPAAPGTKSIGEMKAAAAALAAEQADMLSEREAAWLKRLRAILAGAESRPHLALTGQAAGEAAAKTVFE